MERRKKTFPFQTSFSLSLSFFVFCFSSFTSSTLTHTHARTSYIHMLDQLSSHGIMIIQFVELFVRVRIFIDARNITLRCLMLFIYTYVQYTQAMYPKRLTRTITIIIIMARHKNTIFMYKTAEYSTFVYFVLRVCVVYYPLLYNTKILRLFGYITETGLLRSYMNSVYFALLHFQFLFFSSFFLLCSFMNAHRTTYNANKK